MLIFISFALIQHALRKKPRKKLPLRNAKYNYPFAGKCR